VSWSVLSDLLLSVGVPLHRAPASLEIFSEVLKGHRALNPDPARMIDNPGHALPDLDSGRAVQMHNNIGLHSSLPHGGSRPARKAVRAANTLPGNECRDDHTLEGLFDPTRCVATDRRIVTIADRIGHGRSTVVVRDRRRVVAS
jgi:hypothetical protein